MPLFARVMTAVLYVPQLFKLRPIDFRAGWGLVACLGSAFVPPTFPTHNVRSR